MANASSPLARKLLLKPGQHGALVNPPSDYRPKLDPLPEGFVLDERLGSNMDFVQVFAKDAEELRKHIRPAVQAVTNDGLLWICYPKGGKKAGTDLNRDILWNLMTEYGMAGVSLVSIDDTWSAMRFRPEDKVGQ